MKHTSEINCRGQRIDHYEYTTDELNAMYFFNSLIDMFFEEEALRTAKARFPGLSPEFWASFTELDG